jgi:transglutaminase-like putative cysteine protease
MIARLLSLFTFIVLLLFVQVTPAQAATNFKTDYKVTYSIDESGVAHSVVNITLTNLTSQYFAPSYKMQLGFNEISNVTARDAKGPIQPIVTKNDDGYVIEVKFNNKAVGLDSKQQFDIMFDTPKIARNHGKIWEIDIPGISNPNDFASFVVDLKVPSTFGQPAYIKPKQPNSSLTFNKETLGKSGISIAFGEKQTYKFNLTYHLSNPNLYPISTEIALPPNTNYQDVYINTIEPKPENVIQDKDGNWLAQYRLKSAQKMDVIVQGNAEVNLKPEPLELTPDQLQTYTLEQKYWETSNTQIRELADELKTPERIYQYVVEALDYDFSRVTEEKPRLGALGALQNQNSAVCREFTDLFIALARAAGIPAREINGFAYTENAKQRPLFMAKDILHVWPEYYDREKKTWVMVDPTWGSTTGGVDYFDVMDFAHLAFVIKGTNSEYPIPAGGYKFTDQEVTKDVQVEFTTTPVQPSTSLTAESTIPDVVIGGLPIQGNVKVSNTGSAYLPPQVVYLTSSVFSPNNQTYATDGIPPFGSTEVAVKFQPAGFLTNTEGDYTIRVAGATNVEKVKSSPFFVTPLGGGVAVGILAFTILIIAIKSRRLRLFR